MSEVKLTKGQKFVSKYYPDMKLATVRSVETYDGTDYVLYERVFNGSYSTMKRLEILDRDVFLLEYQEKEDFFVVGGKYTYYNSTLYVKEVFTISNPLTPECRKQARAVVITKQGKRYMDMFDILAFDIAKRVR